MHIAEPTKQWIHLPGMRKHRERSQDSTLNELRLPLIGFLPNKVRNHVIGAIGEFTGTFLFLFCAFAATQVANAARQGAEGDNKSISNYPNTDTLTYISMAFGLSLATNAWIFFRVSGGLFNPAVTLALCLVGAVGWIRGIIVTIAQILAATAAAAVGLFIETLLTAQLVLTIIMLAAEKHKGTFLAPVGIGLSLFIAELTGVYFTGGSLNPARSFGPCVVLRQFPDYHWIYWLGPYLGGIIAAVFYHLIKVLEYETANPGQDFNELEMDRFAFDEENAATGADAQRPDLTSPPLEPTVTGYRGRSASTRTRHLSPIGIDISKSESHSDNEARGVVSPTEMMECRLMTPSGNDSLSLTSAATGQFLTPPRPTRQDL